MIKQIRVDYRLLHGQVAVSWTSALGADCLLLVSDTVKSDPLRLETLKLAKPAGTKVVVKNQQEAIDALNSGVTDKYKLFIINILCFIQSVRYRTLCPILRASETIRHAKHRQARYARHASPVYKYLSMR